MSIAKGRITQERKRWRKDHPPGFFARPETKEDGSTNMFRWKCHIPGRKDTIWEGGYYPISIDFPEEYPQRPPKCKFSEGFYHPNVYPSGTVCLSILNEDEGWVPSITVKQILMGIQDLLTDPNPNSPAQTDAYLDYTKNRDKYELRVKKQVEKFPPKF
ncbi:ubiquitin-conjugating enzyme E2 [Chloropicon roscoffensis]|uniref:SUMO-conjugating enzyme UBC9 n=2 Tax=Chloropicon roscoffensis TaxID=1461544 RepID=A0AAX4NXD3_9CHLO